MEVRSIFALVLLVGAISCGGSTSQTTPDGNDGTDPEATGGSGSTTPGTTNHPSDGPEISRSAGVEGGVLVFWPRVIPRTFRDESSALAGQVQAHLTSLVESTLPGRPVDVRPEPERVCRLAGCNAMTVGVMLARNDTGCLLIGLGSGPGTADNNLVPWLGQATINDPVIPFRDMPETHVTIRDFVECDGLVGQLGGENDDALVAEIERVGATLPAASAQ